MANYEIFRINAVEGVIKIDIESELGYLPETPQQCELIIKTWVKETNANTELDKVRKKDYFYKGA